MGRFCIFLLLLVYPVLADKVAEQTVSTIGFIPGPQTAAADDAWSLFYNPAGLAFVEGAQFVGGYEHQWADLESNHHAQGVIAFSPISGFAIGVGGNLILPSQQSNEEGAYKGEMSASLGLAFRAGRVFSLGIDALKRRELAMSSDPFLFGIGTQLWPISWFAFGASFHQVDGSFASPFFSRVGVSFVPLRQWVTVSLDNIFSPKTTFWKDGYSFNPSLSAKVNFESVSLYGGMVVHDVTNGFGRLFFSAGLEFNFEHIGVMLTGGAALNNNYQIGTHFRLSSQKASAQVPQTKAKG